MESVKEKFLRYVAIDTQSEDGKDETPSTKKQFDLAYQLESELKGIGAVDVSVSEHCYVMATIPGNNGKDHPVIGLIAHLDTSYSASGKHIHPIITENYDGKNIPLSGDKKLSPEEYPSLLKYMGKTIISTDGTTLLGADDKAGIAEIMALAERLMTDNSIKHGPIRIAFTPDEEIGMGTACFELEKFGADFAYTVDGGEIGEINYECFNAARADITINGYSIHTGSAKGKMKNASLIGMELHNMLPPFMNPAATEGREGFFHLEYINGAVEKAQMKYILRDHDRSLLEKKKELILSAAKYMNEKYGNGTIEIEVQDSYYNMADVIDRKYVDRAVEAMKKAGIEPWTEPIRGGTDGSALSFRGLPCPNLCTGGANFHGPYEFICLESMEKITEMLGFLVSEQ